MKNRPQKGKSMIAFPGNYTVIDVETTGYSTDYDDMIEVAAVRVRGGVPAEIWTSLISPGHTISPFIEQLTGITNEMLAGAPAFSEIAAELRAFLSDDPLVGHNVNFDINFLYDAFSCLPGPPLDNNYIDTLRLSRKLMPELEHHRLEDVSAALGVEQKSAHRSMADCETTFSCFNAIKNKVLQAGTVEDFRSLFVRKYKYYPGKKIDLRTLSSDGTAADPDSLFYGKRCVFTGALERMTRAEAAQIVVNIGGICENGVTKQTNFLILGNLDYSNGVKGGKSAKMKKAEDYKLRGQDIEIIPESVFYEILEEQESAPA